VSAFQPRRRPKVAQVLASRLLSFGSADSVVPASCKILGGGCVSTMTADYCRRNQGAGTKGVLGVLRMHTRSEAILTRYGTRRFVSLLGRFEAMPVT
jgi:hypothetical protein